MPLLVDAGDDEEFTFEAVILLWWLWLGDDVVVFVRAVIALVVVVGGRVILIALPLDGFGVRRGSSEGGRQVLSKGLTSSSP